TVDERQILVGLYTRLDRKEKALEVEMELASIFFEKGDLDESATICAKIISEDPKHIRAHQKLLEIHTRTGQKDKAKEESRALAEVLAQDNQLDSAIEMLQNLVKANPGDLSARSNLCEMLERSGFTGRALSEYLSLGAECEKHGDLDGAIETYRKAVSLDHASVDAHLLLGKILLEKKQDFPAGVRELQTVCELHPNHTDALSLLWFGYVSLGSAIPALETGAMLRRLDAGSAALFSKAKEDLEQVVRKDTSNIQALYKLALVYRVSGDLELAIRILQSAAKKVPENVVKLYGLAGHCFVESARMKKERGGKEGDSDWESDLFAAKAQFQKALQYKGKRPDEDFLELHYFFGNYHEAMGQKNEALAQYQEALMIDPDHRYSKEKSATIEV
ncbi:MAG: tetratricopeptide repeat protein, partial [Armatimonadetes bacterium]|nr:tetratricopeptide repeat protein [Armatimonadota bacterium]